MEFKLFGKSLFELKKSKTDILLAESSSFSKESKYLPDFYGGWNESNSLSEYVMIDVGNGGTIAVPKGKEAEKKAEEKKEKVSPKGLYELKLLNDKAFKLNTDEKFIDEQLESFKDKLGMIKTEEYDMRRGVQEISSVVARLENRKKYSKFNEFYEQFPYTQTSKINDVLKAHDHLKLGQIAQFIADMPKEAVNVMKEYNSKTEEVCGKKAVFYIIADKKDFKQTNSRRDPILVAQSPFGHFWQILGAWDKEMMFLEEL